MALPEVGTLYQNPAIPTQIWSQPGGPNTTVYPQAKDSAPGQFETPLTPSGQYIPGCGHAQNALRVWEEYDPESGEQAAIICCGVCTFVIEIIIPYSLYLNYLQNPIVIA